MSLAEACAWSLLRAVSITLLVLPICHRISRLQHGASRFRILLLALPFLMPEVAVGYAYRNSALSLVHLPLVNELACAALIAMKLVPIGIVIVYFSPPPRQSWIAEHCSRLLVGRPSAWTMWGHRLRAFRYGAAPTVIPTAAVVFLLAFQEFEMTSLMQATSWTVWLFDMHAGGLKFSETWRYARLPLTCELIVLLPTWIYLHRRHAAESPHDVPRPGVPSPAWLWAYVGVATLFVVVIPVGVLLTGLYTGWSVIPRQWAWMRSMAFSGALCFLAGGATYFLSRMILSTGRFRSILIAGTALPGLLGGLVLGLSALAVFQTPPLSNLYGTPIPLIVTLTIYFLPRGILILAVLRMAAAGESFRTAELLRGPNPRQSEAARELTWRLRLRGQFGAMAILSYWAYLELTVSAILKPIRYTPVVVSLYNQMHYGRIPGLTALLGLSVVIPIGLFLALGWTRRPLLRWLLG